MHVAQQRRPPLKRTVVKTVSNIPTYNKNVGRNASILFTTYLSANLYEREASVR